MLSYFRNAFKLIRRAQQGQYGPLSYRSTGVDRSLKYTAVWILDEERFLCLQVERLQRKFTTIHSTLAQQQTPKLNPDTPRASAANLSQSVGENLPKVTHCLHPGFLTTASEYQVSAVPGYVLLRCPFKALWRPPPYLLEWRDVCRSWPRR